MGKKQKGTGVQEGGAVFGVIQFNHLLTSLGVLGSSFIWGWVFYWLKAVTSCTDERWSQEAFPETSQIEGAVIRFWLCTLKNLPALNR